MSNFQNEYKRKPSGFANVGEQRVFRAIQHEKERKKQRAAKFDGNRNLMTSDESNRIRNEEVPVAIKPDRATKFLKWKQEKEKRKRLEQTKKKPFVVGVVHHKIYSPVVKDSNDSKPKPCLHQMRHTYIPKLDPVPKRITKATEKRLQSKAAENKTNTKVPFKMPTAINKDKEDKKLEQSFSVSSVKVKSTEETPVRLFGRVTMETMTPVPSKSFKSPTVEISNLNSSITNDVIQPDDASMIDAKNYLHCTEDSSIEAVALHLSSDEKETLNRDSGDDNNEKKTNNSIISNRFLSDSLCEPVFYSPYVVSSRGKDNARKEQQLKRGFSLGRSPKDDIPTKETVMQNLNISIEDEERTAQYFQFLLNREIERLNELCDKWAKIQNEPETTEDGRYEINQAIGQTNLLMNKKFERFRRLVADCETGKGEMLVTCKDLQGFWDMMYIEIENCDERFEKLEKLRALGWEQVESLIRKPVVKKRNVAKKKVAPTKSSSLRSFLARKRNMAIETKNVESIEAESKPENSGNRSINDKFTRRSLSTNPSPVKSISKRSSLLRKVQLSENSKKIKSPLMLMKISQMCKTPVVMLDDTISYINSDQTPAKSILKQSKNSAETESRKLPNKVNFDDQVILNDIPVDEETQVKLSLAAALTRIDSLNLDSPDEFVFKAERKLNFDDSFDERRDNDITPNNTLSKSSSDPEETEKQPQESKRNRNTPRRGIRRQNAVDTDVEKLDRTGISSDNIEDTTSLSHARTSAPFTEIKGDVNALEQEQNLVSEKGETSENDGSIRILRNRTIAPSDTTSARKSKKVNIQEPESKENEIPQRKRRSSAAINSNKNEEVNKVTPTDNGLGGTKRRSTRNVKFSESEDNNIMNKPALPMTPHVKSSRKSSRKSLSVDSSLSLEIPGRPPERVRRSQTKRSTNTPQIDA
ncbi:disks large-associated protein 5-like [Ceratina calcarata]|uniref:Disks large-associated protein 5-like n=1 Tax=Ceratina calcarata TaxID=156304 RepID=A0AAJ7J8K4_9HYME|nr:disks large-associated protein 5-like [Ceratina calcarata]